MVIRNGGITAIAPGAAGRNQDLDAFDAEGMWIIPGLWDLSHAFHTVVLHAGAAGSYRGSQRA